MMRRMRKLILPAAGVLVLLIASRGHGRVVVTVVIAAGVPVALLLAAVIGWLVWRTLHDSLLPRPAVREVPPAPQRAEVRIIRGELES